MIFEGGLPMSSDAGVNMVKKLIGLGVLAGVACGLVACETGRYRVDGTSYPTAAAAQDVRSAQLNVILESIGPTSHPLGGKALVALPSRRLIEATLAGAPGAWEHIGQDDLEYVEALVEMNMSVYPEAIRRRALFSSVAVVRSDRPELEESSAYRFIIYQNFQRGVVRWYLKSPRGDELIPVYEPKKLQSWLEALENKAESLVSGDGRFPEE